MHHHNRLVLRGDIHRDRRQPVHPWFCPALAGPEQAPVRPADMRLAGDTGRGARQALLWFATVALVGRFQRRADPPGHLRQATGISGVSSVSRKLSSMRGWMR